MNKMPVSAFLFFRPYFSLVSLFALPCTCIMSVYPSLLSSLVPLGVTIVYNKYVVVKRRSRKVLAKVDMTNQNLAKNSILILSLEIFTILHKKGGYFARILAKCF
jgi:predicted membrane-bound mannosyltransferase